MNEEVKQSIQGAYLKNDKPYTIDDIASDQHGFFWNSSWCFQCIRF